MEDKESTKLKQFSDEVKALGETYGIDFGMVASHPDSDYINSISLFPHGASAFAYGEPGVLTLWMIQNAKCLTIEDKIVLAAVFKEASERK